MKVSKKFKTQRTFSFCTNAVHEGCPSVTALRRSAWVQRPTFDVDRSTHLASSTGAEKRNQRGSLVPHKRRNMKIQAQEMRILRIHVGGSINEATRIAGWFLLKKKIEMDEN